MAQVIPRRDDDGIEETGPDLTVPHADVMNVAGDLRIAHRFAGDAALFGTLPVAWAVAMNAAADDPRAHLVFSQHQGGGLVCARIADQTTGVRVDEVILLPEPWSSVELIAAVGAVAVRDGRAWGTDLAPMPLL